MWNLGLVMMCVLGYRGFLCVFRVNRIRRKHGEIFSVGKLGHIIFFRCVFWGNIFFSVFFGWIKYVEKGVHNLLMCKMG